VINYCSSEFGSDYADACLIGDDCVLIVNILTANISRLADADHRKSTLTAAWRLPECPDAES
jgi:hypothetical protein